jgi:hypothetical protein
MDENFFTVADYFELFLRSVSICTKRTSTYGVFELPFIFFIFAA